MAEEPVAEELRIFPLHGIGEVGPGDDIAELIAAAGVDLAAGDVVVVTSKIVSKAEGRLVELDREAAIDAETVRVVAQRGQTRIVETRHGFVMAAAGVDASNVPAGTVALLPVDPDGSAERIRVGLRARTGVEVGVIVTDTMGRPWRNGLTDVCIGAAGIAPLADLRGTLDATGHRLDVTVTAVADELAAAADLVKGKLGGVPVAVVRGWPVAADPTGGGARVLLRSSGEDMFRYGAAEARRAAVTEPRPGGDLRAEPVDPVVIRRLIESAAVATGGGRPWRLLHLSEVPADWSPAAAQAVIGCVPAAVGEQGEALLSLGAAVERVRILLAADGLSGSWTTSASVPETVAVPAGWRPVGRLVIGRPAGPATPWPALDGSVVTDG